MEKNVVSFTFKMTTKTQRGHYYMIKIYVMDTNVLIQSPNALFSFEDNLVVLPMVVLEELDHLKKADGETGANARKCIRLLEELRQKMEIFWKKKQKTARCSRSIIRSLQMLTF